MAKKPIRIIEIFFVVVGVQVLFSLYFYPHIVPCFLLVYLLNLVWDGEKEIALLLAFLSGIIYDTINKLIPGLSSIVFLVIIYLNSFFLIKSFFVKNILIFIFSMIYFASLPMKIGEGFLWSSGLVLKYSILFSSMNLLIEFIVFAGKTIKWRKKEFS